MNPIPPSAGHPLIESSGQVSIRPARSKANRLKEAAGVLSRFKMLWLVAACAMLTVIAYRYENWNGAREIAASRERVLARVGTLDPLALLRAEVAEGDNFFAIPVIQKWRVPRAGSPGFFDTNVPENLLVTDALIAELAVGLDRPFSQVIPCRSRAVREAGGDLITANIPGIGGFFTLQKKLADRLELASKAGDGVTTRQLVGIMLKLGAAFSSEPELVIAMVGRALHGVTFQCLTTALDCARLTENDYKDLQNRLLVEDDLAAMEKTFQYVALQSGAVISILKQAGADGKLGTLLGKSAGWQESLCYRLLESGPRGWWDANAAFAMDRMLEVAGPGGAENWREGDAISKLLGGKTAAASSLVATATGGIPNLRRMVGCTIIPAVSGSWKLAAENAAMRRCAVLACALHRHRLLHGAFPKSLTELDAGLLPGPGPQMDPAKAEAELQYRVEKEGFLLWSVGMDRVDDGGDADRDWIWRQVKE